MKEAIGVTLSKDTLRPSTGVSGLIGRLSDLLNTVNDIVCELRKKNRPGEDNDRHRDRRSDGLARKLVDSSSSSSSSDSSETESKKSKESRMGKLWKRKHENKSAGDEGSLRSFSVLVRAEFQHGYHRLGEKFAQGDLLAEAQLQDQLIALQSTTLKYYQLQDRFPPAEHIFQLRSAARFARTECVKALADLSHRLALEADEGNDEPHMPGAFPKPHHGVGHSNELMIHSTTRIRGRSCSRRRPKPDDEDSSTVSKELFCPYALDLQRHLYHPLAAAFRDGGDGRCPYCRSTLGTRPGKAWEVVLDDDSRGKRRRAFLIGNRFVVKCHREGGGLACVLCRRFKEHDTVCKEIEELMDHIWREHAVEEVEGDEDIRTA